MSDKFHKMKPTEVSYATYLEVLVKPWFTTGEFAMSSWTGKVILTPVNKTLIIYVANESDFDLAVSILNDHFPEEKKDIEVKFTDKVVNLKN